MLNVIYLMGAMIFFYFIYLQEQWFWSSTQNRFCKKYCGHCEDCNCWSCTRKEYIDEYKNIKSLEYKIYEKGKQIEKSLNKNSYNIDK